MSSHWLQRQRDGLCVSTCVCMKERMSNHFPPGSSAETIALLTVGCVLLVSAAINELLTKRSPIVPPRLFQVTNAPIPCHPFHLFPCLQTRTTGVLLVSVFLHAIAFFSGANFPNPRVFFNLRPDLILPFRGLLSSRLLPNSRFFCHDGGCEVRRTHSHPK